MEKGKGDSIVYIVFNVINCNACAEVFMAENLISF